MVEKLTLETVKDWIPTIKRKAHELQYTVKDPTEEELKKFVETFNRRFILHCREREIADIYRKHASEILLGLMIAKEQMDMQFDGDNPKAGTFGVTTPHAGFFGEDDWAKSVTGGTTNNIIHAGNTHIGGTAGDPVKIPKGVVHVIIGYGNYSPSPLSTLIQETINGASKPSINTDFGWRASDLQIVELGEARILKYNSTYKLIAFSPTSGTDEIYVIGATFLAEDLMRINDPANMAGSDKIVTS